MPDFAWLGGEAALWWLPTAAVEAVRLRHQPPQHRPENRRVGRWDRRPESRRPRLAPEARVVERFSRKGDTPVEAGPDFTSNDVKRAQDLFESVARYFVEARPDRF